MTHQTRVFYRNGSFVPEGYAALPIYDSAIVTGEVVTEVTRTFRQRPYRLRAHLERLFAGAAELRITPPLTLEEICAATATEARDVDWQIIHYLSRGPAQAFGPLWPEDARPTVLIHCLPLVHRLGRLAPAYERGVDLIVTPQRAIPADIISPQIKSRGRLDYLIARSQAAERCPGATGVLLDSRGFLAEATGATIYTVRHGRIATPPGERVLRGVTRALIFDLAARCNLPIEEAELTPEDAKTADEMFLTSTVICLAHARSFEAATFGNGFCGPITRQIRQAFYEEVEVDFNYQAQRYAARL